MVELTRWQHVNWGGYVICCAFAMRPVDLSNLRFGYSDEWWMRDCWEFSTVADHGSWGLSTAPDYRPQPRLVPRTSIFSKTFSDLAGSFRKIYSLIMLTGWGLIKVSHENWEFPTAQGFPIGQSKLALFPGSSEDVSKILSYCNQKSLKVVVQAGNTSLVAGSVPEEDEIILCTGKMNKVIRFDESTGVLQCEGGCILENLENLVQEKGFIMPYDLGAKGSCQIGGNCASNAGKVLNWLGFCVIFWLFRRNPLRSLRVASRVCPGSGSCLSWWKGSGYDE